MEKNHFLNRRWVILIIALVFAKSVSTFAQTKEDLHRTDVNPVTGDKGTAVFDNQDTNPNHLVSSIDPSGKLIGPDGKPLRDENGHPLTVKVSKVGVTGPGGQKVKTDPTTGAPLVDEHGHVLEEPAPPKKLIIPVAKVRTPIQSVHQDKTTHQWLDASDNLVATNQWNNPQFDPVTHAPILDSGAGATPAGGAKNKNPNFKADPVTQDPNGNWINSSGKLVVVKNGFPEYDSNGNATEDPKGVWLKAPAKAADPDANIIHVGGKNPPVTAKTKLYQKHGWGKPEEPYHLKEAEGDAAGAVFVPKVHQDPKTKLWYDAQNRLVRLNAAGNPMGTNGIPVLDDGKEGNPTPALAAKVHNPSMEIHLSPEGFWVDARGRFVAVDEFGVPHYNNRGGPAPDSDQVQTADLDKFYNDLGYSKKDGQWFNADGRLVKLGSNGYPEVDPVTRFPILDVINDPYVKLGLHKVDGKWVDAKGNSVFVDADNFPLLDDQNHPQIIKKPTLVGSGAPAERGKDKKKINPYEKYGIHPDANGDWVDAEGHLYQVGSNGNPAIVDDQAVPEKDTKKIADFKKRQDKLRANTPAHDAPGGLHAEGQVTPGGAIKDPHGSKGKPQGDVATGDEKKTKCDDELAGKLLELVSKDNKNILGRMFELTAMKLASRILRSDPNATTPEGFTLKQVESLKKVVADSEIPQAVLELYSAYGEKNDLAAIKSDLDQSLNLAEDTCHWHPKLRLNNGSASAFVLALSLGEKDSALNSLDAATVWTVEALRAKAEASGNKGYAIGKPYGNLMNLSTRVARYLGKIAGAKDMRNKRDELEAMITKDQDQLNTQLGASIQKALTSDEMQKNIYACFMTELHPDCADCGKADLKKFMESQTIESLKSSLVKRIKNDETSKMEKGLTGHLGSIDFDFGNFAQAKGEVEAFVRPKNMTREQWEECADHQKSGLPKVRRAPAKAKKEPKAEESDD